LVTKSSYSLHQIPEHQDTDETKGVEEIKYILFPTDLPLCSQQLIFHTSKPLWRWSLTWQHIHICDAGAFFKFSLF